MVSNSAAPKGFMLTLEREKPASNIGYEDEGSEGSQDEYRPPAYEGDVESDSGGESTR